jgi:hypothetical protein
MLPRQPHPEIRAASAVHPNHVAFDSPRLTLNAGRAADLPLEIGAHDVAVHAAAVQALVIRAATHDRCPSAKFAAALWRSTRFAPFPWGPRPPMKADISTLHKPDILILQRQATAIVLTS